MMKILISEFKKNRPWLDLDNGELVSVIKKNIKDVAIDWIYQIEDFSIILEKIEDYELIFIHIDHQSINYALLNSERMKKYEYKIIIYGYGVLFNSDLRKFKFSICNDDIHDVIKIASNILSVHLEYNENEL